MTNRPATIRFAVSGALAMALLGGCASHGGVASADRAAAKAQVALAKGDANKAIAPAEAAVAASPRDAARRALLAHAYLKDGRFASAATTFEDAMKLGDNSSRTALALALAQIGAGRQRDAVAVLDDWRDSIPASDLGLALALAGDSRRGVGVLADSIRGGDNTPKSRQNLAYAYALDGRWREARLMAEQDVPADQVSDRIGQWAATIQPEASQQRVATLLGTPLRSDSGQPQALALANSPSTEQLAAEASALVAQEKPVEVASADVELAPVGATPAPAVAVASYVPPVPEAAAPVAAEPAPQVAAVTYQSQPVVQSLPERVYATVAQAFGYKPARPVPTRVAVPARPVVATGTHLVQLGSFASPQGARRAWGIYSAKNPGLRSHRMVITAAVVRGKNYWRVAAGGLDGSSARGLCSDVKTRGGACFAYAAPRANAPVLVRASIPPRGGRG